MALGDLTGRWWRCRIPGWMLGYLVPGGKLVEGCVCGIDIPGVRNGDHACSTWIDPCLPLPLEEASVLGSFCFI